MTTPAAIVMPLTPSPLGLTLENPVVLNQDAGIRSLTTRLAAGEDEAFREFHAAYFDRLLRYLLVVTRGDEDAARDVLQETLTRVVRYARPFDCGEALWSWLTVLARSAAADRGRKLQRYWRLLANYARFWSAPPPEPPAEEDADEHLHAMLNDGLRNLAAMERALVEGKYFRGASVRELSMEFHLTERAVESRLLRARRQLREDLLKRLKNE